VKGAEEGNSGRNDESPSAEKPAAIKRKFSPEAKIAQGKIQKRPGPYRAITSYRRGKPTGPGKPGLPNGGCARLL